MEESRSILVSCPECEVEYRLWDETLLTIARCGRCYGEVVREEDRAEMYRPLRDS
jgi:hypothetical protein